MIIGMVGKARSGKNTVADMLQQQLGSDVSIYAFADPIKETVNRMFGWDDRHRDGDLKEVVDPEWGFSPRHAYQTFGTEWGRECLRGDLWLYMAKKVCNANRNTIITDVRFLNEADWIRNMGGVLVKVTRPDNQEIVKSHKSEMEIDLIREDHHILNNAGLQELLDETLYVIDKIGDKLD